MAWWSDSFPSSIVYFLPGGSLTGSGSSGTATATYASVGFGPVGALYESVLAMALAVTVLTLIGGSVGVVAAWGKIRNPRGKGMLRGLIISGLVVALASLIIVPPLQPYTLSQSSGGCSGYGSESPCNSFWGAGATGGVSSSWGANLGFYLMAAAAILLVVSLLFWIRAWSSPWGSSPEGSVGIAAQPLAPGGSTPESAVPGPDPIERLLQLKQLLDSGRITEAEFQQAKSGLFTKSPTAQPQLGSGPPTGVEESLARLRAMRDSGQLSEAEYAELRARVLARL